MKIDLRLALGVVMLGCSTSSSPGAVQDAATADASDAAMVGVDAGIVLPCGYSGGSAGSNTCDEELGCGPAAGKTAYRIDCNCATSNCACELADGGAFQTVPFNCDAGPGCSTSPLPDSVGVACGFGVIEGVGPH